jgi:predicted nucleic acid-binding protein
MPILVAAPILTEAHSLIVHRLGPITAQRWLQEVFDSAAIVLPSERDFRAALQTIQRFTDQSITLTDAILAVLSRRLRLPVWTYDHHFDIMQVEVWREI